MRVKTSLSYDRISQRGGMGKMAQEAYICLTDDQYWAIATGDGVDEAVVILAVGRPFNEGADIRAALVELEAWAHDNGYALTTPEYSVSEWALEDLIEPEVFDEVFGEGADAQDEP
ncbi:MAG: hypothetical protein U0521_14320 [Anaerolineae bacterium]